MAVRREGRGQLSSIDLLPDEAQDDIVWACEQLDERRRTQTDILFELNDRLEAKGCAGISKTAFSRFSVKRAMMGRRLAEQRQIFAGLADRFSAADVDQNNVILGEIVKMAISELLQRDAGALAPKGVMELARAYASTIAGQKASLERRESAREKTLAAVDAAAQAIEERQPGADLRAAVKRIREEIYGLMTPAEKPPETPPDAPPEAGA